MWLVLLPGCICFKCPGISCPGEFTLGWLCSRIHGPWKRTTRLPCLLTTTTILPSNFPPRASCTRILSQDRVSTPPKPRLFGRRQANPACDCNAASPTSGFDVWRDPRGVQAPRSGTGVYFTLGNVDPIFELPASGVALKILRCRQANGGVHFNCNQRLLATPSTRAKVEIQNSIFGRPASGYPVLGHTVVHTYPHPAYLPSSISPIPHVGETPKSKFDFRASRERGI
ncbi:hypothetical protein DFH06DRAFT_1140516 [Mycena polygramma]|nr:hypothetical protein DFH06DRAFT_1140516 [Mycena polygramma]